MYQDPEMVDIEIYSADSLVLLNSDVCSNLTPTDNESSCTPGISRGLYNITLRRSSNISSTNFSCIIDCE